MDVEIKGGGEKMESVWERGKENRSGVLIYLIMYCTMNAKECTGSSDKGPDMEMPSQGW